MKNDRFASRHNGTVGAEINELLNEIGASDTDSFIADVIPDQIRPKSDLKIADGLDEHSYLKQLRKIASKNQVFTSYIGLGYYNTIVPPVILRNLFENPGWYTAYTPYQAEISQGRMEALINFQTMVSDLTGMEIANASLLDESTAAAEAMAMFFRNRPKEIKDNNKFFVAEDAYPQTKAVLETRAKGLGIELVYGDAFTSSNVDGLFGILLQYPNVDGTINDYIKLSTELKAKQVQIAVAADLMSLTLIKAPGEWGADAVVGSSQRFGVPLGYGGPHAAFFATHESNKRIIPGRIIGVSVDAAGKQAYRMALQTREQHIKRDKATSNICTAQVLLAVMAGMYAVYHGPAGLKRIASDIHRKTTKLKKSLVDMSYEVQDGLYFDTIKIIAGNKIELIKKAALDAEINLRYDASNVLVSLDETVDAEELKKLLGVFAKAVNFEIKSNGQGSGELAVGPLEKENSLFRTTSYLTHQVFSTYHSETTMMRYLKHLENKDLSLTHSMIALGSCTMKLNAAAEMIPVSWPEFSNIHPFVPVEQVSGYQIVIEDLKNDLCKITGFADISFQPNSGAQGEYAGLLVIQAYHESRNEGNRDVVLIPRSAHGTNPASAVMAGMKVIVVNTDDNGNIDLVDLKAKAEQNKENLSALMVTYPSTHGVYETSIKDVTKIIHDCGGQVYMDGANMNAQVGLTNPAIIGADVCHLNLHKTFSIPHGGGGPGMGPIGVAEHLAPFLPGHPLIKMGGTSGAVASAPWGSSSILLISYGYVKMMGGKGMKEATELAIINANYIKSKLQDHYPVLYVGAKGHVAHEMIIDCRGFKNTSGVEVTDIAKRLIDYGYHAPTISFPVPGTMMIEPTESEDKNELDRFCEAMISIREEIREIENGNAEKGNNVLSNSPHTISEVTANNWEYPYSREKAAYPLEWLRSNKFWASVKRVDNAYGDRNLICSCPSIEEFVVANS
ncbi:MAG: aminomethyl-transferring glycine dehydrogenase [Bacteroidia bacterium]|nr:aminomethyl-transferring glycine dehydrogenase [Bacteroidia bacterium]